MVLRKVYTVIACALGIFAAPAIAQDSKVMRLQPSGPWQMLYQEDKCRLGRYFGEGEQRSLVLLEQRGPSTSFVWTVAGPPFKNLRDRSDLTTQWGPLFDEQIVEYRSMTFPEFGTSVMGTGMSPSKPNPEAAEGKFPDNGGYPVLSVDEGAQVSWIRFSERRIGEVVLELRSMEKPFAAMNLCIESLVKHWGFEPEIQKARNSGPIWTNISDVARKIQRSYPSKALRRGSQALLSMRIRVDADGKPTDCILLDVTEADNFDTRKDACYYVMQDAEFRPAVDAGGNAIASFYIGALRYVIP